MDSSFLSKSIDNQILNKSEKLIMFKSLDSSV